LDLQIGWSDGILKDDEKLAEKISSTIHDFCFDLHPRERGRGRERERGKKIIAFVTKIVSEMASFFTQQELAFALWLSET
jgi:hypothetical protein